MGTKSPSVSVVIANHNGMPYLRQCLCSVTALAYPRVEVVLVDNASDDWSVPMAKSEFPTVKMVVSETNRAYGGGNNLGTRFANGDYILYLNSDAVVEPEVLTALVKVSQHDYRIGVLGCKIYFPGSTTLQHAGGVLRPSGEAILIGYGSKDMGQFDAVRDVDWVSGAAIMVRRDVIDTLGGFDRLFGLYYEEIDLCLRARKANFRVVYVPEAVVYHPMSATIDKMFTDSEKHYRSQRSRITFVLKNFGRNACLVFTIWELRIFASHVAMIRSDATKLSALIRAYCWNILNLRAILRSRSPPYSNQFRASPSKK